MTPGLDIGKIAIYAFVLIFCAIGIGLAYGAFLSFQDGETTNAILMFVAALVFGGFGLGVLALTTAGFRSQAREAAMQATHPGEPWMWRDDWAAGRIRSTQKGAAWFFWGFAILWNLISTPLVFFLPEEIFEKENYAALMGFLFPLVGIGLIVVAVRKTIQHRKYGECLFIMDHVPGVLGGEVKGYILLPRGLQDAHNLNVLLSCIQMIRRRSGKDTTTTEDVLWQTEPLSVRPGPSWEAGAQRAAIRISVPYDARPTERINENNAILWRLEASAAVPGVDFATSFEIPVFRTQVSSPEVTEEHLRSQEVSASTPPMSPSDNMSITVASSPGGGTEFIIRPRPGVSGILPGLGIALFLGAIVALLVYDGAPFLFPLVVGMFALMSGGMMIFMTFGESRIVVEEGHVSIRNSIFGLMTGRRLPCSSIKRIGVKGEARGAARGYYAVTLTQEDEKTVSPLQFLPERRHADWLAEEVRKAMEPWRTDKRPQ
ncbi:MAG TPA: hypothetical protein VLT13_07020, partial [Bacteroidota bacterium]|nr:hypothetical protein [Bacteroidota bacterium]